MTTIDHPAAGQAAGQATGDPHPWSCPVCGCLPDESSLPCTTVPIEEARARWPHLAAEHPAFTATGVASIGVCGDCAAGERPAPRVTERAPAPEPAYSAPNESAMAEMPLSWITPSQINPRRHFDQGKLEELAASLRTHGMLEPLVVRELPEPWPTGQRYSIIAGERRWRAATLARLTMVPVRVLLHVDDKEALQLALVENLQRADLDPIEEAEGYKALHDVAGLKQAQIATAVKRSQPAIAKALGLLDLPADVQELVRGGQLSVAHGAALLRYRAFPEVCSAIAAQAVAEGTTSKALEREIPDQWKLQNKGLLQALYTRFDVCKTCPFDAKRSTGSVSVCLKPEHYEQLRKEDAATRLARARDAATAVAQAREAGADALSQLRDLAGDSYEEVSCRYGYDVPEACTADCPCRGQAVNWNGNVVDICTDPARYKALRDEEAARKDAAVRAECASDLEYLERIPADVPPEPAQVAFLLSHAMQWGINVEGTRAAVKRHAPALWDRKLTEVMPAQLATLPVETQLRLAFEVRVRQEIAEWQRNHRYGSFGSYAFYGWLRARRDATSDGGTTSDTMSCDLCGDPVPELEATAVDRMRVDGETGVARLCPACLAALQEDEEADSEVSV